jgi:hypothetical protein
LTVTSYKHTQIGWAMIVIGGVVIAYAALRGFGTPAMWIALVGVAAIVALFSTLTVTADDDAIEARFGPGIVRRRLPWSQIRTARLVRNHWLAGLGIRWIGSGWMFNVSGRDALELELANGRRFRIGTDDPAGLHRVVATRLTETR